MEDLSKTQIVLLCLLVSFVTSIGTGIISFSLLDEAPHQVTQTINRVVERTIETVVPATASVEPAPQEAGETTVVVKEDDLVVESIEKNTNSVVRIKAGAAKTFYGLGVIVSSDGLIAADRKNTSSAASYSAELSSGKTYQLSVVDSQSDSLVVFFRIKKEKGDSTVFTPSRLGNSDTLALGQTVISLSGTERNTVSVGRITGIQKDDTPTESTAALKAIETNIILRDSAVGGLLLNLSGEVIGMDIRDNTAFSDGEFMPVNLIKSGVQTAQAGN